MTIAPKALEPYPDLKQAQRDIAVPRALNLLQTAERAVLLVAGGQLRVSRN